jgi:tetratricopeptide (TPR) repeat protein
MDEMNESDNLDVHLQSRLSPEESDQLCGNAKAACERGEWNAARELFEQARNRDPFAWKPVQGLGVVAFQEGRLDHAWALMLAAFEAAPEDIDNADNLLAVGRALDREEQAAAILAQAARRLPNASHLDIFRQSPTSAMHQAAELCQKGEDLLASEMWREAMFPFFEALDRDASGSRAWSGLGVAAWRQNFRQVALSSFARRCKRLPPTRMPCSIMPSHSRDSGLGMPSCPRSWAWMCRRSSVARSWRIK